VGQTSPGNIGINLNAKRIVSTATQTTVNLNKTEGATMYTSIRRYTTDPNNAVEIINFIQQENINELISCIPGFIAYYIIDGGDGTLATVSVFKD
jgi:hypothetical protein